MSRGARRLLALVAAFVCTTVGPAQPEGPYVLAAQDPQGQRTVFTSRTQGVIVDVLVTERNRPVTGLAVSDFELRDNGVLQTIDAAEISDAPLNAVLALDMSGSTAGQRLVDLRAASAAFVNGLRPTDRVALTTFNHAVAARVPLGESFAAVDAALNRLKPSGETGILDGVYVALITTLAEAGRSLVIVFTDGRDTASWLVPDEVVQGARRSNAVVYTVATGNARLWSVLTDLADVTGGRRIDLEPGADLRRQFERILLEFRSRYVLTFTPKGVSDDGFHQLSVRVRRGGVEVKARPGYIATGGTRP
jgi:Ca-activated chloride channel family protein